MRFQLDHHPYSLPNFNISIKDGKAVKFIEPDLGSSYRAIEELINHKFHGIPRELVDFIHINKPDSKLEKSMCFDLSITRRGGSEITPPSTPSPSDLETIQKKFNNSKFYLLDCHCNDPNLSFLSADKKIFFIQEHWIGAENGTMNEHKKPLYCFHTAIEPRVFLLEMIVMEQQVLFR